ERDADNDREQLGDNDESDESEHRGRVALSSAGRHGRKHGSDGIRPPGPASCLVPFEHALTEQRPVRCTLGVQGDRFTSENGSGAHARPLWTCAETRLLGERGVVRPASAGFLRRGYRLTPSRAETPPDGGRVDGVPT